MSNQSNSGYISILLINYGIYVIILDLFKTKLLIPVALLS